jgi:hypothetical protein
MTAFEVFAVARDWALIWLSLLGFIISLLPLFLLFKTAQGLGRLLPQVVPTLRRWRQALERVLATVERGMAMVSAPFLWLGSTGAALRFWLGRVARLFSHGR